MDIYNKIYEFCKVKNAGSMFRNGTESITPRAMFIIDLITDLNLDYELDIFDINEENKGYNIILTGSSNRWVTAHHDIVNPNSDNANDNSCSVINAIALKLLVPEINIAIIDGEEYGGQGSQRLSDTINAGKYGDVEWILNLELTGKGGKDFFIGAGGRNTVLGQRVIEMFECDILSVPFNDSMIFRRNQLDSIVINPVPRKEDGTLDTSLLWNCHSMADSVDTISPDDMKIFTEEVLVPIVS